MEPFSSTVSEAWPHNKGTFVCFRKLVLSKFTGQKVIIVFETIFWRLQGAQFVVLSFESVQKHARFFCVLEVRFSRASIQVDIIVDSHKIRYLKFVWRTCGGFVLRIIALVILRENSSQCVSIKVCFVNEHSSQQGTNLLIFLVLQLRQQTNSFASI